MKGFTKDGKFHPITEYKGVRKSRDQSSKSEGIKLERKARDHTEFCPVCKRYITSREQEVRQHIQEHIKMQKHAEHTKQGIICDCGVRKKHVSGETLAKMFEIKPASGSDERTERQFDRFTSSITDFGSGDIASAVEKADEVGIDGRELADIVREFGDETETPLNDIDVVAVLYDHILQNARNEIDSVLNFDIQNDADFYVAGNFLATSYDYSSESLEKLTEIINKASKSDLQRLSESIFVRSFLTDVEVF